MLIRVFLHAEFISAKLEIFKWKQLEKSYDFLIRVFLWKMQKNRKMISFGNFCSFFEVFTETLEQNIRKSEQNIKNVF